MSDATYTIAVRALCEFTAKSGDLDLRFTPGPSAEDGMLGHATVRARRAAGYQSEVSLEGEFGRLRVRGRADGYDAQANRVEEIKTYRGALERIADNHRQLHWAQAKIYAHLLCQKLAIAHIDVALVYYEIGTQHETVLCESHAASSLEQFFTLHCQRFLKWAEQELQHRAARDTALRAMPFPYPAFRRGQRELAEAVYKATVQQCDLMVQAPTGIGKTIGSLFPMLKAAVNPAPRAKPLDKIFYLAAKTSGRHLALDALSLLGGASLPIRVLELVARDKACEHPDKACHGESCPLARGFYERLPAARQVMLDAPRFDRASLRTVALAHDICPYYLSQEMVRWADVVVGDYNYYFDSSALLHGMTCNQRWRVGLLIDEAHNLVERARNMYSAELDQSRLHVLRKRAPPSLQGVLNRLNRQWNLLYKAQQAPYQTYAAIPEKFLAALENVCAAIGDYLVQYPNDVDPAVQQFYFDGQMFCRLAESYGGHSLFDISLQPRRAASLCIRNVVPAPFLKARFADACSATLFSATLSPWQYYSDMLGTPADTPWLEVASPFDAAQLAVTIVPHISTRYRERAQSLQPIVDLIVQQFAAQPGNYFAFFSSFDYLQDVLAMLREHAPRIPVWEQSRDMGEAEREQFLLRFTADGQGIGFAVLGGAFAEAIDLPGERLIGAFIATLGLPQINSVNEQIRMRMQAMFGAGYDYTYLYPGLQKVVQAAGRVIRTTTDRGTIFLIDDRFNRRDVRQLLPGWWRPAVLNVHK